MKNIILCLSIVSILGACSSLKIEDNKAANECLKKGTWVEADPCLKLVKKTAGGIPQWMKKVPQKENAYYSAGTAISSDLQLSIDKSTLNAKRTLADRINGEMSAQIKTFMIESGEGAGTLSTDIEQVTKNVIAKVNVAGYNVSEVEIAPQGSFYRTYVLIEYPVGQANDILVEQVRKNNLLYAKIRASESFKELEESVDEKIRSDQERIEAITESVGG
tara:strand:- start:6210 stop:6866 length:657 start_codon:yes stop_codon:yes gene_type:complete